MINALIIILVIVLVVYLLIPPEEGAIYTDNQFRAVKVIDVYKFTITVYPVTINTFGEIKESGNPMQIPWLQFKSLYSKWRK